MTSWIGVHAKLLNHCPAEYEGEKLDRAEKCIVYLYIVCGWSIRQITDAVEGLCTFHTIRNVLVRLNVERRTRGGAREKPKKVTLCEDDLLLSGKEIAGKYNISHSHAYALKKKATQPPDHSEQSSP